MISSKFDTVLNLYNNGCFWQDLCRSSMCQLAPAKRLSTVSSPYIHGFYFKKQNTKIIQIFVAFSEYLNCNMVKSYSQHTVHLGKLEFALRLTQLSPTRSLWNKQSSSKEESWPARKSRLKTRQKIVHIISPVLPIWKQHKKIQLLVLPINTCLLPNADIVQVRLDFFLRGFFQSRKDFKNVAWIRSQHLHLQWKFK